MNRELKRNRHSVFGLKAIELYLLVVLLSKQLNNIFKIKEKNNFKFNI